MRILLFSILSALFPIISFAQIDSGNIWLNNHPFSYKIKSDKSAYNLVITQIDSGKSTTISGVQDVSIQNLEPFLFNSLSSDPFNFTFATSKDSQQITLIAEKIVKTYSTASLILDKSKSDSIDQSWIRRTFLSTGSTFDFKDGLRANHFYAEVEAGTYFLGTPKGAGFFKGVGFHGGIYKLETTSIVDSSRYIYSILQIPPDTPRNYITAEIDLKRVQSRVNLTFWVEPKYAIYSWTSASALTGYFGFAGRIDYTNSTLHIKQTRESIHLDTTQQIPSTWKPPFVRFENLPQEIENIEISLHELFLGGGLIMLIPFSSAYAEFKGQIGKRILLHVGDDRIEKTPNFAYLVQINIHETKKLGFKFGAEIRGPWITDSDVGNPNLLQSKLPFISVHLAKTVNIKSLGEALTP